MAEGRANLHSAKRTALEFPEIKYADRFLAQTPEHQITVISLFEEEMALKLEQGTDALYDAMDRHDLDHVFRLTRGSLTERKKFLGLF